jgi:hypothetical protein
MAKPRIANEGFQAMKRSQPSGIGLHEGPSFSPFLDFAERAGVTVDPSEDSYEEDIDALLARLTAGQDDGPTTTTLGDEDWVGGSFKDDFLAGEPVGGGWEYLPGDSNMDGHVTSADRTLSAFLAGEPIGTAYDPFSETDPDLYDQSIQDQLAFQRNEEANLQATAAATPSSDHQFLKNHLKANSPLSFGEIRIPVGPGGMPDVQAAKRINVFPFVEKTDYEHLYYQEAMIYQNEQARRGMEAAKPAMDLGGTEGVDFATRLRESFLNR